MTHRPVGAPSSRFPRSVRLRRSPDFQLVQRTGRKVHGEHLVVLYLRRANAPARFGLAVSRKVGNAVVRNRVKRWLRESIRRQRMGVENVDVVFIARPSAPGAGYSVLYAEVSEALARVAKVRS